MHTGDRLISLDGRAVASASDFRPWLGQLRVGQTARLEVMRDGVVSTATVLITGYDRPTVRLREIEDATAEQLRLRARWADGGP